MFASRPSLWDLPSVGGTPPYAPLDAQAMAPGGMMPAGIAPPVAPISPALSSPAARLRPGDMSAMATAPAQPGARPSFFGQGGVGRGIAGALGDALLQSAHMQPIYAPLQEAQRQQSFQQQREARRVADERATWLGQQQWERDNPKPDVFTIGNDRVRYDPTTGQSTTLFHGQTDAQQYAASLGLTPDAPGYADALKDFTLRGYGPTAMDGRLGLEDARQDDRVALEGVRQGNRASLRAMPTYANLHPTPRAPTGMAFSSTPRTVGNVYAPILAKVASGKPLSAGEQQIYDGYQRRRGGGRGYSVTPGGGAPRVPGTAENPAVISKPGDEKYLPKGTHFRVPDGRVLIR